MRPTEIEPGKATLFGDMGEPGSIGIRQGQFDNSWFLASLASIAQ